MSVGTGSPAWILHETLMEVLRRLNQAYERGGDAPELEFAELERSMRTFWASLAGETDFRFALGLLRENGLIDTIDNPVYAWDRQRVVGERFRITTLGKAYLHRQIQESGRIA